MEKTEVYVNYPMILFALAIFIILILLLLLSFAVGKMASRRGRSVLFWFILSLFVSPLICMLILYLMEETDSKRRERIIEEERLRNAFRQPVTIMFDSNNLYENWKRENPGKSLNDFYSRKRLE